MSLKDEVMSFILNKKMDLEEKIKYLEYLNNEGLDLSNINDDYISKEKVKVNNVIRNIYKFYENEKIQISQIMRCEKIGIKFEYKENTKFQIAFLKRAMNEGIDLLEITKKSKEFNNNLIFKYICDLRKKDENYILSDEERKICLDELKIILPKDEKHNIIMMELKNSALKNIFFSDDIKNVLETNDEV